MSEVPSRSIEDSLSSISDGEGEIPFPGSWDLPSLLERSTRVPAFRTTYHVEDSRNTSARNWSLEASNVSSSDHTGFERNETLAQTEVAVLATIFALAVVGNVCVLVALARRRKITSRMHMFILHLSVSDLLVAFCNILPQLIWDITGTFRGGDFLCRTVTFLQVFVMYLSTYVLVMTAVDRYRAICYPLSNYSWSSRTMNVMIVFVYLLSALLSIPQILLFKYQATNDRGDYDCWADFDPPWILEVYILSFTCLVYVVPFLVLVFAYGSICYTIWINQPVSRQQDNDTNTGAMPASLHKAGPMTSSMTLTKEGDGMALTTTPTSTPTSRRWNKSLNASNGSLASRNGVVRPRAHSTRGFSRAKLKTVKLTFVVIVAYLFCWSPFFISHIWWLYDPQQENNSAVVIMVLLSSLNSCCNPWIYLAFSGNLLKHLFPCLWPFCPSAPPTRRAFLFNTPSNSPQRAIEMPGYPARPKAGLQTAGRNSPLLTTRPKGRHGLDPASPDLQNVPVRHSSLTSLVTMRISRRTSGARQQGSGPSPEILGLSQINGRLFRSGRGGQGNKAMKGDQEKCLTANGCVVRLAKVPPSLVLRTNSEEVRDSSSSSNPRSPHLFKRARLHERPREEVAEAQLKWEQNMGITRSSNSCFVFGIDTQ